MLVLDIHEASPAAADEFAAGHGATVERIGAEEFAEQVRAAEQRAEESPDDGPDGPDRTGGTAVA